MGKAEKASTNAIATMTSGPQSISGIAKAWEKTQSSVDPVFAAQVRRQKEVEKAFQSANAAVAAGLATHDQAAATVGAVAAKYDALTAGATKAAFSQTTLGKAMGGVSGQLVALSAGAGPVGVFLSSLGPWGLAGAVGVGAISGAMSVAATAADRFATEMLQVRDAAQSVGLSTIQLQGIKDVGEQFALGSDKINATLQRFTAQMDDFRKGQGELFALVQRIDPALAKEMAQSRSTAEAISFLAKAYDNAGTSRQKLDRLIGGRNGGTVGLLFQEIGAQGGVDATTAAFEKSGDAIDKNLIEKIAKLRAEIDNMAGNARNNFASLFSLEYMEQLRRNEELWLNISRAMKNAADQKTRLANDPLFSKGLMDVEGLLPPSTDTSGTFDSRFSASNGSLKPVYAPIPQARPSQKIDRDAAQFEINQNKEIIAAMGSGATAAQKLAQRRRELTLALNDNIISQEQFNRSIGIASMEVATTAVNARIGVLGVMASTTDAATAAQLKINRANIDGANVNKTQAALVVEAAKLQLAATKQNIDAQYGLSSSTDMASQKTAEFINIAKQRNYTEEQTAAGLKVVERNAKAASEASQIAASATPQLAQLSYDTGSLDKQFDQFAVGGLNNMTTALADVSMNTKETGEAFRNLGLTVVRSLNEMIIKMMIVQPIAQTLQATLKGGVGGAGGGIGGFLGSLFGSAQGNAFAAGARPIPHSMGDIVSSPSVFPMAGGRVGSIAESEPEAVMPLKRGRDGKLGVSGSGAQQVTNITYAPNIDARGADAAAVARIASAQQKAQRDFGKNVLAVTGKARRNMQG